jgi:hypothetical protein
MEMMQILPGTAGTFSHYWEDVSERLNIRACPCLYSAAKLASIARTAERGHRPSTIQCTPSIEKNKNVAFELGRIREESRIYWAHKPPKPPKLDLEVLAVEEARSAPPGILSHPRIVVVI